MSARATTGRGASAPLAGVRGYLGRRYRIVTREPGQRRPRVQVFRLVDGVGDKLVFDARPLAGTQRITVAYIVSMEEVGPDTPLQLPTIDRSGS